MKACLWKPVFFNKVALKTRFEVQTLKVTLEGRLGFVLGVGGAAAGQFLLNKVV